MGKQEDVFSDVSTVIFFANSNLTANVKSALLVAGFRDIKTSVSISKLKTILSDVAPDLIICELISPPQEILEIAKSIRIGDFGCNAYAELVALTENTKPGFIQKALNAGFDDVIVLPISTGLITDRLLHLAQNRKPFVMNRNYVGPDRRTGPEISGQRLQSVKLVNAPNPLNPKDIDLKLAKHFKIALSNILSDRIAGLQSEMYKEIQGEVNHLIVKLFDSPEAGEIRPLAPELKELLVKYGDIIENSAVEELPSANGRLLNILDQIDEHHREAWSEDFDILQHLMELVLHAQRAKKNNHF